MIRQWQKNRIMPELWGLLKNNDRAPSRKKVMSIWKSCTRTVVQRIKCVSQDSFSAKVTSTTAMIVVASFVPRFGSFERNPFSSTSTRSWWFREKWQKANVQGGASPSGHDYQIWMFLYFLSYTFERVQEDSDKVWKFQRYELIAEYHGRPLFFPPLIFISHILLFVRWIWQLCRCCNPPSGSSMSKLLFVFLGNCPPTPPLTQRKRLLLTWDKMLGYGRGRLSVSQKSKFDL